MNYFQRLRDATICIVLLVLPFVVLNSNLKDPSKTNALDKWILRLSSNVQWLASQSAYTVSDYVSEYTHLVDVNRDNNLLQMENARLRQEVRLLRRESDENRRLRRLLSLKEHISATTISAEVIAKEFSEHFRVIRVRIDRGIQDRIRPHMPVISTEGLVGEIRSAEGHFANVTLTVDRQSAVDVVVARTNARGILRGTGDENKYLCQIEYLQRTDDVHVGDEVYTSGMGHRFPASIYVGKISRIIRQSYGLYQQAEVIPSVDFSRLSEVLVLTEPVHSPDELNPSRRARE